MPGPPEYIVQIVALCQAVLMIWHPVVVSAVDSLTTASSGKVSAEPSRALFVEAVCLGKATVLFWVTFEQARHSFVSILPISKILIVPYIIIVVAFNICHIAEACIIDLLPRWPLQPFLSLHEHLFSEDLTL